MNKKTTRYQNEETGEGFTVDVTEQLDGDWYPDMQPGRLGVELALWAFNNKKVAELANFNGMPEVNFEVEKGDHHLTSIFIQGDDAILEFNIIKL